MKLACVVLAHRNARQLARFLGQLTHPAVHLYLHIDSRAPLDPFKKALGIRSLKQITLLPRYASRWGGIEVVDATLQGLTRGVSDGCDYFLLLSGQDMPLWSVDRILDFFESAGEASYVEHVPLPDARYNGLLRTDFYTYTLLGRRETCIPRGIESEFNWRGRLLNTILLARTVLKPPRRFPSYVKPFGGSQWWNLSRPAVDFVLRFLVDHPDYRTYHEHTLLPDELYIQSILLGTEFAERHRVVNDSLRFMIWPGGSSHPKTLGLEDVPEMLASGKPFARKFDAEDAPGVTRLLVESWKDLAPRREIR
jgi:Core-2/I-Branching enzyme